ncbi:MAG: Stage II sporulation protein D (SpoIID) [Brockia lithotrophica]|uniref:Stage II sporulation protein D (SpoIID) n=1 Tax=Brockia lithotrophica TaxID=933949 RepID=A0A2T5GAU9_9BACL|nr:stage II sporulation protein D [Brockia lithotrophica]PTQ53316.1 MAG: Stage II sporulation protein D (SpoIID) [Brockia lithotrophica]
MRQHERGDAEIRRWLFVGAASLFAAGSAGLGAYVFRVSSPSDGERAVVYLSPAASADVHARPDLVVSVFRTQSKRVEEVALETYVAGVVAGEMPASFSPEALKAQAVAARTYAVYRLGLAGTAAAKSALRDDDWDQVYHDETVRRGKWGEAYPTYDEKVWAAVRATEGEILTYNGAPAETLYFAVSNGQTDDARDVFGGDRPYLRSVPSPWDREAPTYHKVFRFPRPEAAKKLEVSADELAQVAILEETAGKQVKRIRIGSREWNGKEVSRRLGLPSATFRLRVEGDAVVVDTYGQGHGVGMSQWGAERLARGGKTYEAILAYYYPATALARIGSSGSVATRESPRTP